MSQRHHASGPVSRSPSDDSRRITLPPVNPPEGIQKRPDLLEWQLSVSDRRMHSSQLQLSPSKHFGHKVHGIERDFGVHSILNPDISTCGQTSARPQCESSESMVLNSTSRPKNSPPWMQTGQQSLTSSILSMTETDTANSPWATRRLLTPKSPSQVPSRETTFGVHDYEGSPRLTALSKQIQTPGPNLTTSSESSLNPVSSISRQQNIKQKIDKHYPKLSQERIHRSSNLQPLMAIPLSKIPSSSALIVSSQNSPASIINHCGQISPNNPYYHPSSNLGNSMQLAESTPGSLGKSEGPYNTPDSPQTPNNAGISRQASASDPIQVLTVTTNQGLYTIPVDVHHASRVADEKRARNAGASARFRQRRKEKEKEANLAIEKLQLQVRKLERGLENMQSERNFYRSERDRLRDIMLRIPETRYYAIQTPPSPSKRHRSFSGQLEIFSGPQKTIISHQDPASEEDTNKRSDKIGENYVEASCIIPSERIISPSYPVSDINQRSKQLCNEASLLSPQMGVNTLLATPKSTITYQKPYNPNLQ